MRSYDIRRQRGDAPPTRPGQPPDAAPVRSARPRPELPRVGLEDALAILLALLDREPQTFSRTEALIELSDRYGLRRVDDLLIAWLQARGIGE